MMIITDEMKAFFIKRTKEHIGRVQKYLGKIIDHGFEGVDNDLLAIEYFHDGSKLMKPEVEPYIHLTWKYKTAKDENPYTPDKNTQKLIDEATYHHVKNNMHHTEYWDDSTTIEVINAKDRDRPSGFMVNATSMPLTYIASMMADWLSMSEEKGTDVFDWIKMNVNIRWKFTREQVNLITDIANNIKVDDVVPVRGTLK